MVEKKKNKAEISVLLFIELFFFYFRNMSALRRREGLLSPLGPPGHGPASQPTV